MIVTTTILGLIIIYVFIKYYIIGIKNIEPLIEQSKDENSDSDNSDHEDIIGLYDDDINDTDDEDNTELENENNIELENTILSKKNIEISELVDYKNLINKSLILENDINKKYENLLKQIKTAKEESSIIN